MAVAGIGRRRAGDGNRCIADLLLAKLNYSIRLRLCENPLPDR